MKWSNRWAFLLLLAIVTLALLVSYAPDSPATVAGEASADLGDRTLGEVFGRDLVAEDESGDDEGDDETGDGTNGESAACCADFLQPLCSPPHGAQCCSDGEWRCIPLSGTPPCRSGILCEACCDPDLEPGQGGLPACAHGATCCSDGQWSCNSGDGATTCDLVGVSCAKDPCFGFDYCPCSDCGCPEGQICDTANTCVPSSCLCRPDGIICTEDCGGGACVPEPPDTI